jgi:DNA-directed RNA polymerase specialized sigma24 family protein
MIAIPTESAGRPRPGLPADGKHDGRPGAAPRAITGRDVRAALGRLSAEHRQVIVEIYYNSRSVYETADVLQIPVATVTPRAYAALRQLLGGLAAPAATSADASRRTAAQPTLGACQRLADPGLRGSGHTVLLMSG